MCIALLMTQPVYAADDTGFTGFLSNVFNSLSEVFQSLTETPTENSDDYSLPFERSTLEDSTDTNTYDAPELNASGASVSYNITFRGHGGAWRDGTNWIKNKTITLHSKDVSTLDSTQVVDIYTDEVLNNLEYFNDDQSSDTQAADADNVIFIGFSAASTGPIIRTHHYIPASENIELWAQWYYVDDPEASFTVSFNAGIGSFNTVGANPKTITKTVKCGDFASDITEPYAPDAANYFVGWYLEEEAGELPSSTDYIMPNATKVYRDMTFTARYYYDDSNPYEYYVKFVSNGGTFSNGDQYRLVKVSRDAPGILPDNPIRDGYTFNGWSTSASDTSGLLGVFPNPYGGAPDAEDAAAHTAENPFVYYACWDSESEGVTRDVTITLQPNGGTFGVMTDGWAIDGNGYCYQTTTIVNTSTVTVDISTFPAISREGYTFKGWSLNGSPTPYDQATYTTGYSTAFTALWVKNNSDALPDNDNYDDSVNYTLTFDANGGHFSNGETTFKTVVAAGSQVMFPEENPTRDAYKFLGWATSASATEPSSFANLRVTGNAKVFAVWTLKDVGIPTQVQLVMGDGYYNNKSGTSTIVTNIGTPISQFYSKSTRTGYALKGFSTEANSTDVIQKDSLVEENMVLYAVWLSDDNNNGNEDNPTPTPTVSYNIVFNGNGGYYDNDPTHLTYSVVVLQGDTISSIPTPKLDNATFLGYGSEINSTAVLDFTNLKPESDSTYYAVWDTKDSEYTVTFIAGDSYGGSSFNGGSQTKEVTVKANEKVTQPEVPLETRDKTFSYWSETKAASWVGTSSTAFDFNTTIKKNTTLYAIYRKQDNSSKFRTVIFDYNGGKLRTKSSVSVDVLYNYPVAKPESPKRSGYSFKGWYTDTDGASEDKWDFDNPVTEDMTLYAVWKEKDSKSKTTSSSSTKQSNTTTSGANLPTVNNVTQPMNAAQAQQLTGATATTEDGLVSSDVTGDTLGYSTIPKTGIDQSSTQIAAAVILLLTAMVVMVNYIGSRRKE